MLKDNAMKELDDLLVLSEKVGLSLRAGEQTSKHFSDRLSIVSHNANVLKSEADRMCDLCSNAERVIDKIDEEFCKLTGLDAADFTFLAIATALQTARWIIIDCLTDFGSGTERDERVNHNDKAIKDAEQESKDSTVEEMSDVGDFRRRSDVIRGRTWNEILTEPVPFDVIDGSAQFGLGLSGKNHREMTLGHDPVLGWFFGTINILTDTTTIKNLRTFVMSRDPKLHFSTETIFTNALMSAWYNCKLDKKRLAAAITMEAIHLRSDFFTKAGLPIPIITSVLPDLSSSLYKDNYDALCLAKDVGIVAMQAKMSILINIVIAQLHGYFFDPKKHQSRDLYEVKTHKILLYSNILAESSNVITVAVRHLMGDVCAWKHLDFGGLLVLLWRIIKDVNFMYKVREDFVSSKFKEIVVGDYEKRLWPIKES